MNELRLSPGKHGPEDEKKRQEHNRRRFGFGIGYLIASLILLKQETVSGSDVKAALETNPSPVTPGDGAGRRPA
jgi:hypothetical protein